MLSVKDPISAWVLSILYVKDNWLDRRFLVRNLCSASFDSMQSIDEFTHRMDELVKGELVEHGVDQQYRISERGIIAFRKEFAIPLTRASEQAGEVSLHLTQDEEDKLGLIATADDKNGRVAEFFIQNAPKMLDLVDKVLKFVTPN